MRRLYIPDLHFPFCDMKLLGEVAKFNKTFKADRVIQLGDMLDFYCFSRFVKDPSADGVTAEIREARKQIKQFAKWFPQVTILTGNHEKRLYKRVVESGVPATFLKGLGELLELPSGLKYHPRDYLELDSKTIACHGHITSLSARRGHMAYFGKSVVFGHLHNQLGVEFDSSSSVRKFGMSASCIVDKDAVAFKYGDSDYKNMICGFGYEDNGKPGVVCLS